MQLVGRMTVVFYLHVCFGLIVGFPLLLFLLLFFKASEILAAIFFLPRSKAWQRGSRQVEISSRPCFILLVQ